VGHRACISIDSLPLQILLKANPGWEGTPVAVTREEKPQSPVLALSRQARERGLRVGMRYANALSLVPALKARAVPGAALAAARDEIVQTLTAFTPDIELCPFDADAVWASVEGLLTLFGTEERWSLEVRAALAAHGFHAVVVAGFTRFGTYIAARARRRSALFSSAEEERAAVHQSSVDILPLPHRMKTTLRKLEIRTVGRFLSLPRGEVYRRFGREADTLWKALQSDDPLPVQALALRDTGSSSRHLDTPITDLALLLPHVRELLAVEAARAEQSRSVIAGLTLVLKTEDGDATTDLIRPSTPTLKTAVLLRLVELRLASRQLMSGVEDMEIRCARVAPSRGQEELFVTRSRDLDAGARAFAALHARFGNQCVVAARLRDSHVPEQRFSWVPLQRPSLPAVSPGRAAPPGAIRRMRFQPAPVPLGAAERGVGRLPFLLSGGWWSEAEGDPEYSREYGYVTLDGVTAWVFRENGASWLQGTVD